MSIPFLPIRSLEAYHRHTPLRFPFCSTILDVMAACLRRHVCYFFGFWLKPCGGGGALCMATMSDQNFTGGPADLQPADPWPLTIGENMRSPSPDRSSSPEAGWRKWEAPNWETKTPSWTEQRLPMPAHQRIYDQKEARSENTPSSSVKMDRALLKDNRKRINQDNTMLSKDLKRLRPKRPKSQKPSDNEASQRSEREERKEWPRARGIDYEYIRGDPQIRHIEPNPDALSAEETVLARASMKSLNAWLGPTAFVRLGLASKTMRSAHHPLHAGKHQELRWRWGSNFPDYLRPCTFQLLYNEVIHTDFFNDYDRIFLILRFSPALR